MSPDSPEELGCGWRVCASQEGGPWSAAGTPPGACSFPSSQRRERHSCRQPFPPRLRAGQGEEVRHNWRYRGCLSTGQRSSKPPTLPRTLCSARPRPQRPPAAPPELRAPQEFCPWTEWTLSRPPATRHRGRRSDRGHRHPEPSDPAVPLLELPPQPREVLSDAWMLSCVGNGRD